MHQGIVHTATLYAPVEDYTIIELIRQNRLGPRGEGYQISASKAGFVYIYVDFIKLLKKSNITERDIKIIQSRVDCALKYTGLSYEDFMLKRFDFRIDKKMPKQDRELIFRLWKKLPSKQGWLKRQQLEKYRTSAYFASQSKSEPSKKFNFYGKEEERIDKNEEIEEYEKDVIRMELQLYNTHLRYQSRANGRSKTLSTYLNDDMITEYYRRYILPTFHSGNYHSTTQATRIIKREILSENEQSKLREFLILISRKNIDAAKERYSPYLFKKNMKTLEYLDINPILIPKNANRSFLENPLNSFFKERKDEDLGNT